MIDPRFATTRQKSLPAPPPSSTPQLHSGGPVKRAGFHLSLSYIHYSFPNNPTTTTTTSLKMAYTPTSVREVRSPPPPESEPHSSSQLPELLDDRRVKNIRPLIP